MKRWITAALPALLLPGIVLGLDTGPDFMRFSFQRGLDYYRWGASVQTDFTAGGENFHTEEELSVMLRQPPGFQDYWKTSLKLKGNWSRPLKSNLMFSGRVASDIFYDREVSQTPPILLNQRYPDTPVFNPSGVSLTTGLDNRIYRNSASMGFDISDWENFDITSSVGIYGERLLGSTAVGPMGNFSMLGEGVEIGGFVTDFNARTGGQFIGSRTNHEIAADFRACREYTQGTSNRFSANYRNYRREFPVSSGVNDRRTEEEVHIGDVLEYELISSLNLLLDLNLAQRKVEPTRVNKTNRLNEIATGMSADLRWESGGHRYALGFGSKSQNQRYPFRTVEGRQYDIHGGVTYSLKEDSVQVSAALARFKYDVSPEDYSIDTRDELRHSYQIAHYHPFGGGLDIVTRLRADLNHLVYLKAARSADNNWERIFILSPEVNYLSDSWSQRARFMVTARYIDYDFAETAPPSRVFRKYSAEDSLEVKLSRQWKARFQYVLILEDQGRLDWERFVQDLSDEYRTHDARFEFVRGMKGLFLGMGWGFYHRKGKHTELPDERVQSSGPILSLSGTGPMNFQIELSTSYRRISETGRSPYSQTYLDMTLYKLF